MRDCLVTGFSADIQVGGLLGQWSKCLHHHHQKWRICQGVAKPDRKLELAQQPGLQIVGRDLLDGQSLWPG